MMRSKNIRKILSVLIVLVCAAITTVGFTACGKEDEPSHTAFALNKTEITLKESGDSEQLVLTKDGAKYAGAVAWTTDSDMIAEVKHGFVTGLRAGETSVNAIVTENGEETKVSCKVTVLSRLTAQTDKIYKYSGSGDIDVSIPNGLMTVGASYEITDVVNSSGASVKDAVIKREGTKYLMANGATSALAAGNYQVVYSLTKGDIRDEAVRAVCVKRADSYTDFLVIDPIDGSENITGSALIYPWTSVADNPSPGKYVVFDDGETPDPISGQNLDSFTQSLTDSGYDGYLGGESAGADTVYRMYVRKENKSSSPYPNYFVNLVDTQSELWGNLDKFPAGTELSIWARMWAKTDGDTEYKPRRISYAYPYKVQNSGRTSYDGASGAFYADGGWTNFRFPLTSLATKLNDARNLGLCFGTGMSVRGDFYLDLYSVEITALSDAFAPLRKYDLSLAGDFSGIFDDYSVRVLDKSGAEAATADKENSVVTDIADGVYTVEYTLKRGGVELPQKTTRTLQSGVVNSLSSLAAIKNSPWGTNNSWALDKTLAKGKPASAIVDKTTCAVRTVRDTEGSDMPSFDISAILKEIDTLDEKDYIGVWAWIEKGETESRHVSMYLSEGVGDWGSTTAGTVIFGSGWGGQPLSEEITFNNWNLVKVYVGEIKQMLAKRPDLKNIDRMCLNFTNMGNRGNKADYKEYSYYYYSVEYFRFDPTAFEMKYDDYSVAVGDEKTLEVKGFAYDRDYAYAWASSAPNVASVDNNGKVTAKSIGKTDITFTANGKTVTTEVKVTKNRVLDNTDKISFKNDGMNAVVANVKEEVGSLPAGVPADQTSCVKATFKSANGGTSFPIIDISSVIGNISNYKANDYISVRLYSDAGFWGIFSLTTGRDGSTTSAQKTGTVIEESGTAWKEVRISIPMLRELLADGKAYKYLMLDNWRSAADSSKPFYYHSWDLVEGTYEMPYTSYSLAIGESKTISVKGAVSGYEGYIWASSVPTVAEVDDSGKVTAKAVGETEISFTDNGTTVKMKIVVTKNHLIDNAEKISFKNDGMNAVVANVKEEVGSLPAGVPADQTSCIKATFKNTTVAGTAFPIIDISSVISNISNYKANDYITVRLYTDTGNDFWGNFFLTTGKDGSTMSAQKTGTVIKESGTAWKEVRISIPMLRELLADGKAYKYLMLDNWRSAADSSKPFYYHSWDLVEGTYEMPYTSYSLAIGESKTISVKGAVSGYEGYIWASSVPTVAEVDDSGKVTAKAVGETEISFTDNGTTVKMKIVVTKNHLIDNAEKVKDWNGRAMYSVVTKDEANVGLPDGVDATQTTFIKAELKSGDTLMPSFDISSVLENLDALKSSNYVSFRIYNGYGNDSSHFWTIMHLTTHPTYSASATEYKIEGAEYSVDGNGWIELRVSVKLLKEAVAAKSGVSFRYLRLTNWQGSAPFAPCYYHSWELVDQDYGTHFDSTSKIKFVNDNMNVSVVNVSDETGSLPAGETKTDCIKAEFKAQSGANTTYPVFDISTVIADVEKLKDTDYVSIKLYSDAGFWGIFSLSTDINGSNASAEKTGEVEKQEGTAWKEVKITIAMIKELLNDGNNRAYNFIKLNNWRGAGDVSKPFYYYSWTLVKA